MQEESKSFKEQRIRKITQLYYSRPDVQKAMFEFSKNREVCPRYFEGFGKRPDSFQYIGDLFELVKKGATSFHCSEEIWSDPLQIETGCSEEKLNNLRTGWDLLIDIDCKYFDFAKITAKAIIKTLNQNGIKNIGLKFSGSKGFHIIIPWKSFPKEIAGQKTRDLFPELPRKIVDYIKNQSEKNLYGMLPDNFSMQFKETKLKKGIKCLDCNEVADSFFQVELFCDRCKISEIKKITDLDKKIKCPSCSNFLIEKNRKEIYECKKCKTTSNPYNKSSRKGNFSEFISEDLFQLMGLDIILVSPRHLFRMPYSLHEKTSFASVVIKPEDLEKFEIKDASSMSVSILNFIPDSKEGEARELVTRAMDWSKEIEIKRGDTKEKVTGKFADFKPIEITDFSEVNFPPCIKKILIGIADGRKRALFVLINFFRSIGMDKNEMEKKIEDWNKKNPIPLKEGYIKSQLVWAYRRKPLMPPNCRDFYKDLGVCEPDNLCNKIKNPVNYIIIKTSPKKK